MNRVIAIRNKVEKNKHGTVALMMTHPKYRDVTPPRKLHRTASAPLLRSFTVSRIVVTYLPSKGFTVLQFVTFVEYSALDAPKSTPMTS